jgi:hypothetical protein
MFDGQRAFVKPEPAHFSMLETLTTIDVTDFMFGASITSMIAVALIALTVACWEIADR